MYSVRNIYLLFEGNIELLSKINKTAHGIIQCICPSSMAPAYCIACLFLSYSISCNVIALNLRSEIIIWYTLAIDKIGNNERYRTIYHLTSSELNLYKNNEVYEQSSQIGKIWLISYD